MNTTTNSQSVAGSRPNGPRAAVTGLVRSGFVPNIGGRFALLPPLAWGLIPLVVALGAGPAAGQLNKAYDEGYKPMLGLAGDLQGLVDSDTKRQEFDRVRDLGSKYVDYLDKVVSGVENAGKNFKDSSNQSWIRATCSATLSAAKTAKAKAEALRSKGEAKADCKAQAIDLQKALTELSDAFKDCWKAHEARRQELNDRYVAAREKWWIATKDDRRPINDLAKKAGELRDKRNELQAKAQAAGKLYMDAQDQCDKAREELFRTDKEKTPDEVERRFEDLKKAEDLVKRVSAAATEADKAAAAAAKEHGDAQAEVGKAWDTFIKEAVEGDDLYKIVLGHHLKAFELAQEYKPFSW